MWFSRLLLAFNVLASLVCLANLPRFDIPSLIVLPFVLWGARSNWRTLRAAKVGHA